MYTKNEIANEAAKYIKRSHFKEGSSKFYRAALRRGWLDEVCEHMIARKKWTYETVKAEAQKYTTLSQFCENSASAYNKAMKMNWMDEVGGHLIKINNKPYSFDEVKTEALKYTYKSEFKNKSSGHYQRARRNGWLQDICKHMEYRSDTGKLHCVYAIYNERLNQAYIGITRQNVWRRFSQHKSAKNVTKSKHIASLDDTIFKKLTDYMFDTQDVKDFAEQKYIDKFTSKGFTVLNSPKAVGSVGYSEQIWTFEALIEEVQKYKSRKEFATKNASAYTTARYHEKRKEIFRNLKLVRNYWSLEKVSELAKQYKTRADFKKASGSAYLYSRKNKILDEVCSHMKTQVAQWDQDSVIQAALKCSTKTEFQRKYSGAYKWTKRNNKEQEVFAHMTQKLKT